MRDQGTVCVVKYELGGATITM